jgi:hypothetical protein
MSINQVAEKIETQETEAKAQIYQAIGVVTGVLNISNIKKPTLLIEEHTYRVSVDPRAFWKHQPGESKSFLTYPKIIDGKLGFALLWVKTQPPSSHIFTLKGCWEEKDNQSHLKIYRNQISSNGNFTSLPLTWDNCPSADGQYWEIEAELFGDSFHVISAIGPFDPPQKHLKQVKKAESDLPRPILKGDRTTAIKSDEPPPTQKSAEPKEIKSELPPPTMKSARTSIAAIDPPESEPITETASEPIALNASTAIEENNIATKAAEVIESIAASENKAIAESPRESNKPEELEVSPVVVEPVTPKTKKASGKSSASKKLSIAPETAEPKKTKEKVKASSSKKPRSLAADRLFLGKQLPPGK